MPPKASVPQGIKDRIAETEKKIAEEQTGTPGPAPAPAAPAPASPTPPATPVLEPAPASAVTPTPASSSIISPVAPEPPKQSAPATLEELLKQTREALKIANTRASETMKKFNGMESEISTLKQSIQETESLKTENEQFKARIADLERQIAALQAATPVEVAAPTITEYDKKVAESWGVDPTELAAYRQDIVDKIMAMLPKPTEPKPAIPAPIAPAKPSEPVPATPAIDQGQAVYLEMLNALGYGPDMRGMIVNDPKFTEFLGMIDGNTKRPIRTIAVEADAARDAVTLSEVYRAFLDWKNAAPAVTEPTKPSHLMPSSKGGAGDLNTNKKPIYSQAQVDEFHRKVKRGDYRTIGKAPDEAKKLADELKFYSDEFAAARTEGRIRG